jgi:hypothetical protein
LLAGPLNAGAAVNLSITGSGTIAQINPDGSAGPGQAVSLTGTVSLDVFGAPDQVVTGVAVGSAWVSTFYQLTWTGATAGAFNSTPVLGAGTVSDGAAVVDNFSSGSGPLIDQVELANQSERRDALSADVKFVSFFRSTSQTNWLTGLTFPEGAGLAPPNLDRSPASNVLMFGVTDSTYDPLTDIYTYLPDSYVGIFTLSSIAVTSPVPEPGTYTLFGLGFAALGWRMRQRASVDLAA